MPASTGAKTFTSLQYGAWRAGQEVMAVTNRSLICADQICRECSDIMLLSSILQILNQNQAQPKVVERANNTEKFEIDLSPPKKETAGGKNTEIEVMTGSGPGKPLVPQPTGTILAGLSLEELIRAVTKFEKPEPTRVVDVFE
jgi:hypothetical protein